MNNRLTSIVVGCLIAGFAGGFLFSQYRFVARGEALGGLATLINQSSGQPSTVDFGLFWRVWDTLESRYVDHAKLQTQKLLYGAITGLVQGAGDPYTVFFEPETSKKFQEEIAGAFGGVGMEVGKRNDVLTVVAPIKDTPAARAGIQAGDRILKINDTVTDGLSVDEAVSLIRGPKGSKVTLTILPNGSERTKEYQLTRETIRVPTVTWKTLDSNIAYVALYQFNQNIDTEFRKAADQIVQTKPRGIIVDLRNNPGGLLDSAVNISGYFLDRGSLVVSEVGADTTSRQEFRTENYPALKDIPTIILVNGGSASASEIMAGALRDNRRIRLVGEKTFGKGSVQQVESFADGSSLKITIARWLTPSGYSISEKGLEPDVKVTLDPAQLEQNAYTIGEPGKDPQLDKAIGLLQ